MFLYLFLILLIMPIILINQDMIMTLYVTIFLIISLDFI